MNTNTIQKSIVINAPQSRVWLALTDARQFGTWFRVHLEGDFAPGRTIHGHITYPGYEHLKFEADVEKIEPEHTFSFRWRPYAIDPDKDYSHEPKTLVEFTLKEQNDGILVTVVESGFDGIPAERRDEAFRMNSGGWEEQMRNIQTYVQSQSS